MVEFSLIIEDEEERIQQVAHKERERIMQNMRKNGTFHTCPVCLEETSPIRTLEENIEGKLHIMVCCGASICNNCADKSMDFMFGNSRNDRTNARCFNCREPTRSATYWAKDIMPNDKTSLAIECNGNRLHGWNQRIEEKYEEGNVIVSKSS